jgi:hypothetical protein
MGRVPGVPDPTTGPAPERELADLLDEVSEVGAITRADERLGYCERPRERASRHTAVDAAGRTAAGSSASTPREVTTHLISSGTSGPSWPDCGRRTPSCACSRCTPRCAGERAQALGGPVGGRGDWPVAAQAPGRCGTVPATALLAAGVESDRIMSALAVEGLPTTGNEDTLNSRRTPSAAVMDRSRCPAPPSHGEHTPSCRTSRTPPAPTSPSPGTPASPRHRPDRTIRVPARPIPTRPVVMRLTTTTGTDTRPKSSPHGTITSQTPAISPDTSPTQTHATPELKRSLPVIRYAPS